MKRERETNMNKGDFRILVVVVVIWGRRVRERVCSLVKSRSVVFYFKILKINNNDPLSRLGKSKANQTLKLAGIFFSILKFRKSNQVTRSISLLNLNL